MKNVNLFSLLVAILLMQPVGLLGQNTDTSQAFWVHEDQVKPAMLEQYEAVSKDFVEACKKHNIKDANFNVARLDEGTYLSIMPVNNMADLDKNPLAALADKMGEKNFSELFSRFNECYDVHRDYMVHLLPEMSYMPSGLSTTTPGEDFRKWHFMHVTPQNAASLRTKISEIKKL